MSTYENVCGRRIVYEPYDQQYHSEQLADIHGQALRDLEDFISIVAEIQDKRLDEDGQVAERLTLAQIRTIREVGRSLDGSLALLETFEEVR